LETPAYSQAEVNALIGGLQSQIADLQALLRRFCRNGNGSRSPALTCTS